MQFLYIAHLHYLSWFTPHALYIGCRLEHHIPPPLWPTAQPPLGGKILKRRFDLAGCSVEMPGHITWLAEDASAGWHEQFYSFRWLREIAHSKKHREAASFAREFINGFMLEESGLPSIVWDPKVAGTRLAQWMEHLELILDGSSRVFRQRFTRSVIQHVLMLRSQVESGTGGESSLAVIWGLAAAAERFSPLRFLMPLACDKLAGWIAQSIREDGMCKSGNPADQLAQVQMLIDIRHILPNDALIYADLAKTIMKMGTLLRFCCHGDGRLALYGGAIMQDAGLIAKVLERAHAHESLPLTAAGGLCRLQREQVYVFLLASYGTPARGSYSGPLAIEFGDGTERIVVNCGGYLGNDPLWTHAVKAPAAHSTLSLDGALPPSQENYRSPAPRLEALERPEGPMLRASLEAAPGIIHSRTLTLYEDGTKITGKDQITCQFKEPSNIKAALRFHLHPDIRCQKTAEGMVSLTSVAGKKWIFSIGGNVPVTVEESIFLGYKGKPQRTLQVVVHPTLEEGMIEIAWMFSK